MYKCNNSFDSIELQCTYGLRQTSLLSLHFACANMQRTKLKKMKKNSSIVQKKRRGKNSMERKTYLLHS